MQNFVLTALCIVCESMVGCFVDQKTSTKETQRLSASAVGKVNRRDAEKQRVRNQL
jgi:hypothetical protein